MKGTITQSEHVGPLRLVPMHQLSEALCDDDDWTGLKDPAERRKRQVRLSLRAYRKRKAARTHLEPASLETTPRSERKPQPEIEHITHPERHHEVVRVVPDLFIPAALDQKGSIIPMRNLYPMSRDHLLPLVEYNVWRATLTNVLILGHVHLIGQRNCRFGSCAPIFPNPYQSGRLPESLKPTALQQSRPHPDWIDILPSPKMRDNAIRSLHLLPQEELCADLMGRMSGGQYNSESAIIAWSNPWEPSGWELSGGFIRRWWMLVQGCDDMFEATNRWRRLRGDDSLVV